MIRIIFTLVFIFVLLNGNAQPESSHSASISGILYSRIGYDIESDKRIIVRSSSKDYLEKGTMFIVQDSQNKVVYSDSILYWGEKWKENYWIADFSHLKTKGKYQLVVKINSDSALITRPFKIGPEILWNETWKTVSLTQLEGRIEMRNKNLKKHGPEYAQGGGWQDCGSYLREVNSHATMLVGLFDLLEFSKAQIAEEEKKQIIEQILIGLDYIAFCQDKARELGKGEGGVIHEWPKHTNVITGDVAKAALCFARGHYLFSELRMDRSDEYLERAERSFNWLDENGPINHPGGTDFHGNVLPDDGFEPIVYGATADFSRPEEWKTRDLVMMMWVAFELEKAGQREYKEKAVRYAKLLMSRQIPIEKPEGRFYGHFKSFKSADLTEKAWEHHHMGYDAGSTFPHYLIPLIQMVRLWNDHPDAELWDHTIRSFAYGYFLPACYNNPFYLLPMGYFKDEGLLEFSGLWHGMNGAYGSAAALALELAYYTDDKRFEKIAVGNLQWIAGLNTGIEKNNAYVSFSMIYGIGDEYIGSWTKIPGTICNGFESDGQFRFSKPKASTDGPWIFTDEGWITHSGGWLSAISRLR